MSGAIRKDRTDGRTVSYIVVLKTVFFPVIERQCPVGADPEVTLRVLIERALLICGYTISVQCIMIIHLEAAAIKSVQAVLGGKPHITKLVLPYTINGIGRKSAVATEIYKIQVFLLCSRYYRQQAQEQY
jgi:hypothetical protein